MMDFLSGPNLGVAKRRNRNALKGAAAYGAVVDASLTKKDISG